MASIFHAHCCPSTCLGFSNSYKQTLLPVHSAHLRVASSARLPIRLCREESVRVVQAATEQAVSDELERMDGAEDDVCELVSRLELTLGEGEDAMDAYLVKAMKNNNGAAVLLLTDAYGYNDNDTRDFAYRLSCFGYNVLVPDIFDGMPWMKDQPVDEYENWRDKHPVERVAKCINIATDWLMEEIAAAGVTKKVALVGFSYGGGCIFEVLARDVEQRRFGTAICFYPTHLNSMLAARIQVPMLLISGDNDEKCSPSTLKSVTGLMKNSRMKLYSGRGHAFVHRPSSVEEDEDSEDAFLTMKSWLHEMLGSTQATLSISKNDA